MGRIEKIGDCPLMLGDCLDMLPGLVRSTGEEAQTQKAPHGRMASEGRPTLPRLVGLLPVQDGKRPGQGAAGAASFGVPVV